MSDAQIGTLQPQPATAPDTELLLPLFRFGARSDRGTPLAIVSGGLILDLGEAERTFIYRCQDRFLAYSSLWGLRSVFFAASHGHVEIYRSHIAGLRARFDRIRDRTGLFTARTLLEPIYAGCDIGDMRLFACDGFAAQAKNIAPLAGVALNQISPTYAALLAQLAALLRQYGVDVGEVADADDMAALAMRCADKADYLALTASDHELPPHVPTALFTAAELGALADYQALAALYAARVPRTAISPARLFVKATLNSSGNLSALVGPENFAGEMRRLRSTLAREAATDQAEIDRQTADLRQEVDDAPCLRALGLPIEQLRACKRDQARHRQRVDFLVQPELRKRDGDAAFGGIGLSYAIAMDGTVIPVGATGQIYRDRDNKHFQGAYWSDTVAQDVPPAFHGRMRALCRRYAARGYRGPINFDARRDGMSQYQLIYDCNPRLTGVFPSLAVRDALRDGGVAVQSLLTLGYRGEFVLPDLDAALDRLDRAGLLCTRARPRGVVVLPNLSRDNGFDLHLVNIGPEEANRLLEGELGALSAAAVHPQRLYW